MFRQRKGRCALPAKKSYGCRTDEEKIELEVRKRITSQKKEILEGSEEWDVLHKKYYHDELRRMGIGAAPDDRQRS